MSANIECIDPLTDARWTKLSRRPNASLFHSLPWLQAIEDCYGFGIKACVSGDNAAIPYCVLNDISGPRVVALPFTDACDPIGSTTEGLLAHLQSYQLPVHLRLLDSQMNLEISKRARWHRLSLPAENMAPVFRRGVRKAQHMGVEVRPLPDIQDFLRLHVAVRKSKYRMLAQPALFFESIQRRFGAVGGWHALGAYHRDQLIAATIYLRCGETLYYKFSASDQGKLALRPNNLLLWEGARLAVSLGCHTLDLGPSDDDQPGLIRFKRNTGASELELQFLNWTPPGWHHEQTKKARALLAEVTRLLTGPNVPDEVAMRAADNLYRYFA